MLVATYDYWGYYNVCFLGDEVREPSRTIPRALMLSIAAVAAIYLAMNISVLGVIPWRELAAPSAKPYVISVLMQRVYGAESPAATVATCLIMLTAFASVFSLLLGYSRVPYAAALDGNYFRAFAHVDEKRRFPDVSLLALGAAACLACFLRLADLIAALVVIRIMLQFLVQAVGLLLLRATRPDFPRPFRMWLYPAARAAGDGRVYICAGLAQGLPERSPLRYLVTAGGAGDLHLARGTPAALAIFNRRAAMTARSGRRN